MDGLQAETDVMLDLPPDRIGHGTCIHPDYGGTVKLLEKTRKANIPLGQYHVYIFTMLNVTRLYSDH